MKRAFLALLAATCLLANPFSLAVYGQEAQATPQANLPPVKSTQWETMPAGRIVEVLPAGETSQVEGASTSLFVRFTTLNVKGEPALGSGLVLLPGEYYLVGNNVPLVLYGHMTTGVADACAPTHGTPESSELRRMQQGDEIAKGLLMRGAVVARPDYEGLGEDGPHPYLQGDSLGRSMRHMATAVAKHWDYIGEEWVAVGHSEGGTAALNSGNRLLPQAEGLRQVGLAAITPVTQLEKLVTVLGGAPVTGPGLDVSIALAALVLKGVSSVDPDFERLLLEEGGLSETGLRLWPDLERLCLQDLGGEDTWGGQSPEQLKGPRGDEAIAEMRNALDRDDLRFLPLRHEVPIRIDAGIYDLVVQLPYTEQLVQSYQERGYDVTYARWPAGHSPTADMAAPTIVNWVMERFAQ